ncbi:retinol dehydrogenase 11-like [Pectinophora gossypiella]|uniref:retinol dehydrogenase 11-like n=1 Tax=Pectinophora gossypiella TaxID=13191 RepID=UPI00214EEF03|nr:retinol dehydrogenase 11-like [Pectinophora gossypiella]
MCDTDARLEGKVIVVTGGSSGIGFETAKNLAKRGARVVIASRNETKLKLARDNIKEATGNSDVYYRLLDLGSLKSVRNFASETLSYEKRLDVLINNAGSVGLPDTLTADGLNLTMQVNYFGSFLLTFLLLPMLKSSAPSRIINSSASSMYIGHLDFDHWNDIGRYNFITALANSKLAETLFTAELDRRLKGTGVTANSFDPFVVKDTDILINAPEAIKEVSKFFINLVGLKKEEVGQQIAYIAAEPTLEEESGQHFKFCRKWLNHWLVSDTDLTKKLWEASKAAVNISNEEDWESSER